jgi:hypothetical protein
MGKSHKGLHRIPNMMEASEEQVIASKKFCEVISKHFL